MILDNAQAAKPNTALLQAFESLARRLGLAVRIDNTEHEYDSLAVGKRPLKNALSVKQDSTSFFTSDAGLRDQLVLAGFTVESAPFRQPSQHSTFRFRVGGVKPQSLEQHPELFERLVRDSIKYVENPIAGQTKP